MHQNLWLTLWLLGREVRGLHPDPATIILGSSLKQVVYSHCLPSVLSSKKLGYTRIPSCRWQTRATRNHAEKCCSSTFK